MTLTVQNASATLVEIIKNVAKLDGAQVKISRAKKSASAPDYSEKFVEKILYEINNIDKQIENGTIKKYKNMDEYEKAHGL